MTSVFVITGANGGLGVSLAREAHQRGFQIEAVSRSPRSHELPDEVEFTQMDCAVQDEASAYWENLAQKYAASQDIVLFNNAGKYLNKPFTATEMAEIEQAFQANFFSSVYMSKGFASHFNSGTIINLNSYAGLHPKADLSVYGAAKAAQAYLYAALREELPSGAFRIMNLYPQRINTWSEEREADTIDKTEAAQWIIDMALLRGSFEITDCTLVPFGETP
ncbi:MAG: SDR family NAD(P)-dependent oxidoreductase [Chloroflexi bacterium]|nr:SDR family NAD(P)-dependent oxidoreductase [Chloroflexota bacterium]